MAAKTHIAEVGLEDKIQTRRSDGLAAASAEEIDTVLIAGMGGGIVIHILTEGRRVAQSVKDLILQPQSELKEVRRFLCNEGYEIVDEDMVLEDGKYYPMMKVRYVPETKARRQSVAEHDFLFGPMLLQKKAPGLTCLSAPGGADPKRGLGASGRTKADTGDRKEDAGSAGIFAGDTKVSVVNRRNKRRSCDESDGSDRADRKRDPAGEQALDWDNVGLWSEIRNRKSTRSMWHWIDRCSPRTRDRLWGRYDTDPPSADLWRHQACECR